MTDPWPAIRREVEGLRHIWGCQKRVCDTCVLIGSEDAVIAALNAKVEGLLMRYGDLLGEAPVHHSPESLITALLNEADDD